MSGDGACPSELMVEGSSLHTEFALWPPGAIECEYSSPTGAVTRATDVPWREWSSVVLFALGAACAALALLAERRRALWAYGGFVLVAGALAVFFVGAATVLLVAAALTPAAALVPAPKRS